MPSYSYKAFDSEGSIQSGFINADNERSARKEIKSLNLIPHKLKKIKSGTKVYDWNIPPEWNLSLIHI